MVDEEIAFIPYYPLEAVTLPWYQDKTLVKQVDNKEELYTCEKLERMYTYLRDRGDLWYITWKGRIVGDISLQDNGEIAIVVAPAYQNRHIGRRCIAELLRVAKEKGMEQVYANVYAFNEQSRKMFLAEGFEQVGEEELRYTILKD
ncbi:MAG: GNAT family N-acetyltransferase [Lachnospiraceae bacterium]|nr:GNAT family N-acetyltransferase [Lachnospiraceae bacterium]